MTPHDDAEALRLRAIEAWAQIGGRRIVIRTDRDLTPAGRRTARIVQTDRGGRQLRWYVRGRIYHAMPPTDGNVQMTREWLSGDPLHNGRVE